MSTVYISIGNSDDKLSQSNWSAFYGEVAELIARVITQPPFGEDARIHGAWTSPSADPWQNACWCLEIGPQSMAWLRGRLANTAKAYDQDSIAWAEAPVTEFLS